MVSPPTLVVTHIKKHETVAIHQFSDKPKLDSLFLSFFDERIKKAVKRIGFNHKVGVLLYGKEGTGKSTILKYYAEKAVNEQQAIVFYLSKEYISYCWEFVEKIRKIQDNPIIIIFDEVDQHIRNNSSDNESLIKTILDGNSSIDNCIFLAATNYLDKIPEAIKNRPSRFKYVLDIEGIQHQDEIIAILTPMITDLFTTDEISAFAVSLIGQTLDFIKQFALDKIMDLKTYKHNSRKTIGFNINS
jgi:SpoVK/Ycf46/Vps4 family AAA+-type ATPase